MWRWTGLLCVVLSAAACNAAFGIDDLSFDAGAAGAAAAAGGGGSGTGGATGGGGGDTGGQGPHAARDWSSSMLAIYRFEDPGAVGRDSSGNGLHLTAYGNPLAVNQGAPEANRAVAIDALNGGGDGLSTAAAELASPPGTSLTFGGWFRVTNDANLSDVVGRAANRGYTIRRDGNLDAASCMIGDGNWADAAAPGNSWPPSEWVHVVCRFDNEADLVTGFLAGASFGSAVKADIDSQVVPFGIPRTASELTGQADEVFVVLRAISDADILRIYACGVTGARCSCLSAQPGEYDDCGRREPDCSGLPPCNAAGPAMP